MVWAYSLAVSGYHLMIRLAALAGRPKARLWVAGRRNWLEKLTEWRSTEANRTARVVWMHCSSLGEFEQGRPVLEAIRQRYPGYKLVLTFYSPSGYEMRKRYAGADYIAYLPSDTAGHARRWLEVLKPERIIFVKYDFWRHHLHAAFSSKIPTVLIAAHFRPEQLFFKPWGAFFRRMLAGFSHIYVQDAESAALLAGAGIYNSSVAGDPRVDRVRQIAAQPERYPLLDVFAGKARQLIVAGSTWPPDEAILAQWANRRLPDGWKLLVAPHEVDDRHVTALMERVTLPCARYSDVVKKGSVDAAVKVLVLDTIGMLAHAYAYGRVAYVGGGFGGGIHNTLEPAAHGVCVIFGPRHGKFIEAGALIAAGGARSVSRPEDFADVMTQCLQNDAYRSAGQAAARCLETMAGATEKIMAGLQL